LANAAISLLGTAALEFLSGVSLFIVSASDDPRFADMMVGVGGWVGGWVAGLEFPQMSMRVKSNNPALWEFRVKC